MPGAVDTDFPDAGLHAEGVEQAVKVVRIPVPLVHGNIQLVGAFHEIERVDRERHLAFAGDLFGREVLEVGVRAVAVDALCVVHAYAEHEIAVRLVSADAQVNRHALARLEDVRGLAVTIFQRHTRDLDLA